MKKIVFVVAFIATAFIQTGFAQNTTTSPLLPLYYNIKDALVSGNANLAASKAGDFVKALNSTDTKVVSEPDRNALLKDAGKIAESKDVKSQREYFASFSDKMIALAKASKLTTEPVYQLYCPMKKSNWLSSEKAVKNPYYGSSMLTCGKVVETLK
jgi:hypothetical protein